MTLTVVTPPAAVVTPADIAGTHASNDATVTALIAAVTAELDAPYGWLGRAIGEQTLRLDVPDWGRCGINLPCGPVRGIVTVKYLDTAGVERTLASNQYRLAGDRLVPAYSVTWPFLQQYQPDAVRITYEAGYATVPQVIKRAIILLTQNLKKVHEDSGASGIVVFEEVEGIGQRRYEATKDARDYVRRAAVSLLNGWRLYQ